MRKLLCALLIAMVLCATSAPAEEIGDALNDMTLEELYALRERVDERIDALENLTPLPLYPSGTYRVGIDIPAGVYLLRSRSVALLPSVLVREVDPQGGYWVGAQIPAGEYAVALAGDRVTANYSIYDDVPGDGAQMLHFEPRAEEGQTVTLEEGWYISLSGCGPRLA